MQYALTVIILHSSQAFTNLITLMQSQDNKPNCFIILRLDEYKGKITG